MIIAEGAATREGVVHTLFCWDSAVLTVVGMPRDVVILPCPAFPALAALVPGSTPTISRVCMDSHGDLAADIFYHFLVNVECMLRLSW